MPKMDGWEVLRWLKKQGELSAIPVAITSAEHARPSGATYFLRKPIDCDVLLQIIRSHAGGTAGEVRGEACCRSPEEE